MSFVRQRLSVAILRASLHCVRGARRKLAPLHLDDGAALPLFFINLFCFELLIFVCLDASAHPFLWLNFVFLCLGKKWIETKKKKNRWMIDPLAWEIKLHTVPNLSTRHFFSWKVRHSEAPLHHDARKVLTWLYHTKKLFSDTLHIAASLRHIQNILLNETSNMLKRRTVRTWRNIMISNCSPVCTVSLELRLALFFNFVQRAGQGVQAWKLVHKFSSTAGIASGHGPGSQTYSFILPQASCLQYPHLPDRSDIPALVAHFFFSICLL